MLGLVLLGLFSIGCFVCLGVTIKKQLLKIKKGL